MTTREGLQTLRQSLGSWTQDRLAQALGVKSLTISRWERELHFPGPRALTKLRALAKSGADQRALAFIDEQIAGILDAEEKRIFGVTASESRKHWVEIAERNWRMRKALKAIEWLPMLEEDILLCPLCDQTQDAGHAPACLIGEALSYKEPT